MTIIPSKSLFMLILCQLYAKRPLRKSAGFFDMLKWTILKNTRLVYWGITYTKMSSDVNWRVFSIYFIKGIPGLHGQHLKWWTLSTCIIICLGVVLQNCILNEVKGNVLSAQKQTIHKVMLTHPHNFDKYPNSTILRNFKQISQFLSSCTILTKFQDSEIQIFMLCPLRMSKDTTPTSLRNNLIKPNLQYFLECRNLFPALLSRIDREAY